MAIGYCTVKDVQDALRKKDLPGDAAQNRDIVLKAITGRAQWLRTQTDGHFYDDSGSIADSDGIIPTTARTRGPEYLDIPSTPHSQHDTIFDEGESRDALRMDGPYTKVKLGREYATAVTTLNIRDASGSFEDWVAASDKVEGPGEDYELITAAGEAQGQSYLLLDTRSLPALRRYDGAVRVTYEYGLNEIPMDIRRAVANAAASDLAEEAAIQIPDNSEVYGVESLAEELERKATDLLNSYR